MREIFLAKADHLPLVAALERASFFEPWSEKALELFLTDNAFCAVCFMGDELASYCTVTTVLDEAQIINVATDTRYRGRGLAVSTLEFVLDECKKRGVLSVSLEVRKSNLPAISLYSRLGFSVAGERRDFYSNPRENALVMIKNLD